MKKSNWLLSTIILAMLFFAISCQYQKQDTEAELNLSNNSLRLTQHLMQTMQKSWHHT